MTLPPGSIIGANGVIIKRHCHAAAQPGTWLGGMLTRKPPMLARVVLANKMARPQRCAEPVAFVAFDPGSDGPQRRLQVSGRSGVSRQGREGVGAKEGKEPFGAIVVRRDRKNQGATECLRARGFDLDPPSEHHTGPQHEDGCKRPDTCQHPMTRQKKL